MSSYEDHVYLAKLAEQAERYEGPFHLNSRSGDVQETDQVVIQRWWKT